MKYARDYRMVNQEFMERGLIAPVPKNIVLQAYVSPERQEENRKAAEDLRQKYGEDNSPAWLARCTRWKNRVAGEVEKFLNTETVRRHIENDDLYFYCQTDGKTGKRDYSYVMLTVLNEEKAPEIFADMEKAAAAFPSDIVKAVFEYAPKDNDEAINREAERIWFTHQGKFFGIFGMIGKLEKIGEGYIFRQKSAKKYFYRPTAKQIATSKIVEVS